MLEYFNLALQFIRGISLPFGGLSVITSKDFLQQIFPVTGRTSFQSPKNIGYNSPGRNLWFQLLIYMR